mgnify:CR=1 FL=1
MKVLFVTLDKCPNLDAGAVRTHMIAKMFADCKHDVTVLSMGPYNNEKVTIIEGIKYVSFRLKNDSFITKALAYFLFFLRLKRFLINKTFDACIHTQVDIATLKIIKKYSQNHHVSLVYDAVDWFSPEQFKRGKLSYTYKLNNNYNTRYIKGNYKVISISTYLYENFITKGIDTLLMPVVLDVKKIPFKKNNQSDIKTIIYAGSPGKKDFLDVIIKGIGILEDKERKKIHLRIIGCNREQFINNTALKLDELSRVEDSVEFVGRIPRESVLYEYSNADFSVLIRPSNARYAQAGFPTKLVESLATATPVMCNCTSDINRYIKHLENGVIVNGEEEQACAKALRCIIKLERECIAQLQKNARHTAEKYFNYSIYSSDLINFIKD